jgi:hypothetical protein
MTYSSTCSYCGEKHGMICPWVKAKEFYPMDDNFKGGGIKRVEFWSRAELGTMAKAANPTSEVKITCSRCHKEGHYYITCPETVADNRRVPYGVQG